MAEERFITEGLNIQDNSAKGRLYLLEEQGGVNALCNLINGLNNKTNRLEKENEELKTKNNAYVQDIEVFKEENTHLKLENEQLKIELDALRKKYNGFSDMVDKRLQEINKGWIK